MPKIKIMPTNKDLSKPKVVPNSGDENAIVERFRPGKKYDLTLDKSFNKQKK